MSRWRQFDKQIVVKQIVDKQIVDKQIVDKQIVDKQIVDKQFTVWPGLLTRVYTRLLTFHASVYSQFVNSCILAFKHLVHLYDSPPVR